MTENIEFRLKSIESTVEKILSLLNGRDGLVTTIELHEQQIKEIPTPASLKIFATIGGGIISGIGIIAYIIYQAIRGVMVS